MDELSDTIVNEIGFLEEHFEELDEEFQKRLNSVGSKRQILDSHVQKINAIRAEYQAVQSQFSTVYSAVISEYRYINKHTEAVHIH
jgi:Na+/phosphate symporter